MKRFLIILAAMVPIWSVALSEKRLVVNVIASGMRSYDIEKFSDNLTEGGIALLLRHGVSYSSCYADYYPSLYSSGIATISTGTLPSVHGISSSYWYNRRSGRAEYPCLKDTAVEQASSSSVDIENLYSSTTLFAETFSEAAVRCGASVATVAMSPFSAILLAGRRGECYWISGDGLWRTGDQYATESSRPLRNANALGGCRPYASGTWLSSYPLDRYHNAKATDVAFIAPSQSFVPQDWTSYIMCRPFGIRALFAFAEEVVADVCARDNAETTILNISVDALDAIAGMYGHDSLEFEDAVYHMDAALARFLLAAYAAKGEKTALFVTFGSGCGSSSEIPADEGHRFNTDQATIIMNAFLSAQHVQDNWVLGIHDGSVYLNHEAIYRHHCTIAGIRQEVANFLLQLRHVATSITADAMLSGSFTSGVMRLAQNGMNQLHSGDVIYTLLPGVVESSGRKSAPGSVYNYDRRVPLIVSGDGIQPKRVSREVDTSRIAPTVAFLAGVDMPFSSFNTPLEDVKIDRK